VQMTWRRNGLVNGASAVLGLKAMWQVTCQDILLSSIWECPLCADDLVADGLVNGASAVLGLKAVWRVTCQDPTAAAATAAALVAACRQGSLQVGAFILGM